MFPHALPSRLASCRTLPGNQLIGALPQELGQGGSMPVVTFMCAGLERASYSSRGRVGFDVQSGSAVQYCGYSLMHQLHQCFTHIFITAPTIAQGLVFQPPVRLPACQLGQL